MLHCLLFYFEKILLIMLTNDVVTAVGAFERFPVRLEMRQLDLGLTK